MYKLLLKKSQTNSKTKSYKCFSNCHWWQGLSVDCYMDCQLTLLCSLKVREGGQLVGVLHGLSVDSGQLRLIDCVLSRWGREDSWEYCYIIGKLSYPGPGRIGIEAHTDTPSTIDTVDTQFYNWTVSDKHTAISGCTDREGTVVQVWYKRQGRSLWFYRCTLTVLKKKKIKKKKYIFLSVARNTR